MSTESQRVIRNVLSMLAEHFGTAVVIVPGRYTSIVHYAGNRDMGNGLISGAYNQVFTDDDPFRFPDPDDDEPDDPVHGPQV